MTREEAIKILDEVIPPPEHYMVDLDHLRIAQAWLYVKETLTAESIRHGRWKWNGEYVCSVCGGISSRTKWNYCPNCGAKMDEVGE